jgi:hypothetical protein
MGGLGNQLFQIFTTISYGLDNERSIIFPYTEFLTTGVKRPTYWNNFLYSLIPFTNLNKNFHNNTLMKFPKYKEPFFHYTNIPNYQETEIMLYGYFQSYKYFQHNIKHIFTLLEIHAKQQNIIRDYNTLFHTARTIVSMHFRIGDYKQIQNCHPLLPYEYYENSINYIYNKHKYIKILYFCEKQDNNSVTNFINKLQNKFTSIEFIKVDDNIPDWEQMLIMSCCSHNIIANSSFSWWGSFFNQNKDQIVCYPYNWFGPALQHNICDLIPNNWNKITYEL